MMGQVAQVDGEQAVSHQSAMYVAQPPVGSVRSCMPYRDELLRHRVITADGHDFAVATHKRPNGKGYITGAYPVQHGYLVMVRQAPSLQDVEFHLSLTERMRAPEGNTPEAVR